MRIGAYKMRYNDVMKNVDLSVPQEARVVCETLQKAGFEAYLVGGCVRDMLLGREPKDWDVTTNAKPEQIQELFFEKFFYKKYLTIIFIINT